MRTDDDLDPAAGWAGREPPDAEAVAALAAAAMAGLPEPFASMAREVSVRVEDWPDEDVLNALGIDDPLALTGLYDGVPRTERSLSDPPQVPDVIRLFRLPILAEWAERGDVTLGALVGHVVVHELADHFGWSDADIAAVDRWWE